MNPEFESDCLNKKQVMQEPGAKPIITQYERENKHKNLLSNSDYFLEGAKQILESKTPFLAVILGFFSMENRANALIALNGYDITNHKCAQIFLSKMLERRDLAEELSNAYSKRIAFNYRLNLKGYQNKEEAEDFLNKIVIPFAEKVDKLVKEYKNHSKQ